MTDTQLYLAIGLPIILNASMFLLLQASVNKRLDDFRETMAQRFTAQDQLFTEKLRRVEEVLDARLKLIEDKLKIG